MPDARLPGALHFSLREGLRLHLLGNFPKDRTQDPRGINILGETTFGEPITVYQALFHSSEVPGGAPAAGESSFIGNKAFIGAHFESMDDARFSSIAFETPYLDTWLQLPLFDIQYRDRGYTLAYETPQPLAFQPMENLTVRIGFNSSGPDVGFAVTNLAFSHRAHLAIDMQDAPHFNEFAELMVHLTNLLALAAVTPVHPLNVQGRLPAAQASESSQRSRHVQVLLPLYASPSEDEVHFYDLLFDYPAVKDSFPQFLADWFQKRDRLQPIFDLFFGALYNTNPYPVTTFLNYAQALETYHIRTLTDEIDPPAQHKERLRDIVAAAPEEHRDWLRDKLAFSNRPTFARRLREVIDLYPFPVTSQAGDHERFIAKVKDTRNYYTHYDPSLEGKAQRGGYLKGLSMTLGTLLEGVILHELGFPCEQVHDIQWKRRRLPAVWF